VESLTLFQIDFGVDINASFMGLPILTWILVTIIIMLMFYSGFITWLVRGPPLKMALIAFRGKTVQLIARANETLAVAGPDYKPGGFNFIKKFAGLWLVHPDSNLNMGRIKTQLSDDHFGATYPMSVLSLLDILEREKVAKLPLRKFDDIRRINRLIEKISQKSLKKEKFDWNNPDDKDLQRYKQLIATMGTVDHLRPIVEQDKDGKYVYRSRWGPGSDPNDALPPAYHLSDKDLDRLKEILDDISVGGSLDIKNLERGDGVLIEKAEMNVVRGQSIVLKNVQNKLEGEFDIEVPQRFQQNVDYEVKAKTPQSESMMRLIILAAVAMGFVMVGGAFAWLVITAG
jgi:hypothetical protein